MKNSLILLAFLIFFGACSSNKTELFDREVGTPLSILEPNPFQGFEEASLESELANKNAEKEISILFSGKVKGKTDVCGCSMIPRGGVERRMNFFRENLKKFPDTTIVFEPGNVFFPEGKLSSKEKTKNLMRAELLAELNQKLGVKATNVGNLDLVYGLDELQKLKSRFNLKLVSTNLVEPKTLKPLFEPKIEFEIQNTPITVLGFTEAMDSKNPYRGQAIALPIIETLTKSIESINRERLIVALIDAGNITLEKLESTKFDKRILFIESREVLERPVAKIAGNSVFLRTREEGQNWGRINLKWKSKIDFSKSGWLSPPDLQTFGHLWPYRAETFNSFKDRPESPEKQKANTEVSEFLKKAENHLPISPKDKVFFEFVNESLTDSWAWTNEFTSRQKALK